MSETGGITVAVGGSPGELVTRPGQLQYGEMLLGGDTSAGWRELIGWRDLPDSQTNDSERPQAHGSYPGAVYGNSLVVTFVFMLRGVPDDKTAAINTIERYAPMDGVERALVVDDGDGPWFRMGRVIGRNVPQGKSYRVGPVECSIQFLCADPRRYSLAELSGTLELIAESGGLAYPLEYPLDYGITSGGSLVLENAGSAATGIEVEFHGPLVNPMLSGSDWSLGFDMTLADGEILTVDTVGGTVLLDSADRLYTLRSDASPLELCLLQPGSNSLSLSADSGTGHVEVAYHNARM